MTIIIEFYSIKLSCPAAKIVIEDMEDGSIFNDRRRNTENYRNKIWFLVVTVKIMLLI